MDTGSIPCPGRLAKVQYEAGARPRYSVLVPGKLTFHPKRLVTGAEAAVSEAAVLSTLP